MQCTSCSSGWRTMGLILSNLFVYLTEKLHQGTVEASNNVAKWYGVVLIRPLIGAHIADAYLGRY